MGDSSLSEPSVAADGLPAADLGLRSRPRSSLGPTPELKQAADNLAVRISQGASVTPDDLRQLRSLVALDLLRSGRPTARAKGFAMLEECVGPTENAPERPPAVVVETPF